MSVESFLAWHGDDDGVLTSLSFLGTSYAKYVMDFVHRLQGGTARAASMSVDWHSYFEVGTS